MNVIYHECEKFQPRTPINQRTCGFTSGPQLQIKITLLTIFEVPFEVYSNQMCVALNLMKASESSKGAI